MIFHESHKQLADNEQLPLLVYESVVRSLYKDQRTLLVGTLSMVVAPLILYTRTADPAQLYFAVLLLFFGALRLIDGMMFHRAQANPLTNAEVRHWELRYATLGALYVGALGMWCFVGFATSSDEFVHQMSVIITLSYLIGILGRNFSSAKVVLSQTLTAAFSLIFGTALFGGIYDFLLGVLLIPLFFTIWAMSRNLRGMLFNAVLTAIDNKTIADRFEIALRNVSHGLAMFDSEGRFVVVNPRFAALVGLPDDSDMMNQTIDCIPDVEAKTEYAGGKARLLRDVLRECLRLGRATAFKHVLVDGTVVEAVFNPMADDGGVVVLEDITERVTAEEEIRILASFDPLTHLPNRRFFMNEVNRLLGGVDGLDPCAVLFVDLDNFKDVNDTLGHAIGDKLLCSIALRMRSRMPEKGMVCRFGGDEFVIVVPGKMRRRDCKALAEKLISEISKPMTIDGHQLTVGASIGIAQCPANGRDYNHLLKVSDVALYDAKARGRGCYSFYTDELGDIIRDRRSLENDLRRAMDRGQLQLHFQPLVDMKRNKITTCEALLRWNHPERGAISPAIFIPVAEEIGIISQIGQFVLEEATRQCTSWPSDVSVAVNVSSLQFQQSDVCSVIAEALEHSGLSACRLEVEVTESAMLDNVAETTTTLSRLAKTGVRISLDDFGTGFSSLSYLHTLPLDKVKIDRSFIENIHDDTRSLVLLSGVAHLANELGLAVVIEGVETAEQMHLLCEKVHVDEMQGYLFGRAMPAGDIRELLQAQRSKPAEKRVRFAS